MNVTNTGGARAFSAAEAGMIARLLRAKSSAAVELGVVIAAVANAADQSEVRVLVTSMRAGTQAVPPPGTSWATAFPTASAAAHTFLAANDALVRQYVTAAAGAKRSSLVTNTWVYVVASSYSML